MQLAWARANLCIKGESGQLQFNRVGRDVNSTVSAYSIPVAIRSSRLPSR